MTVPVVTLGSREYQLLGEPPHSAPSASVMAFSLFHLHGQMQAISVLAYQCFFCGFIYVCASGAIFGWCST
jgi:hypothetical protein